MCPSFVSGKGRNEYECEEICALTEAALESTRVIGTVRTDIAKPGRMQLNW